MSAVNFKPLAGILSIPIDFETNRVFKRSATLWLHEYESSLQYYHTDKALKMATLANRCCGQPAVVMYCISLCTFVFVLLCNLLFHRQTL